MNKQLLYAITVWFTLLLLTPQTMHADVVYRGSVEVEYDKSTTVTLPDFLIAEYNNYGSTPYGGGGTLSWSVSNSSLIIEGTANFSCRIRPRSGSVFPSYVTLTAQFYSWYGTSLMTTKAEWTVRIKQKIHANSISLNYYSLELGLGQKKQKKLVATVYPEDADVKSVTWSSSNNNVATVSSDGLVTAQAVGTATITCEADDKTNNVKATCNVTVTKEDPIETVYSFNDGTGVKDVSNSRFHTFIVKEDGTLWACGNNSIGLLGDGTTESKSKPVFIMDNVEQAVAASSGSASEARSFIVKTDGSLWGWGYNYYGVLGDGTSGSKADKTAPVKIMDGVSSVCASSMKTFIIKSDGSLWACGYNNYGFLGDGDGYKTTKSTPIKILDNVRTVTKSLNNVLALKTDGSLWSWGENQNGEVGDGTTTERLSPVNIMEDVISVAGGNDHFMALKVDGTLWTWGSNEYGQLGDGTTVNRKSPVKIADNVMSIGAGTIHSFYIKKDGSLWTFGDNSDGQLCDGTYISRNSPVKVMEDVAYTAPETTKWTTIIKKDGSLWTCGMNNQGTVLGDGYSGYSARCNPVKILEGADRVVTNFWCTFIIMKDGSLWAYGGNNSGQLGDGTTQNRYSPVEILKATEASDIQTSVRDDERSCSHIYSLSGQRIVAPRKGINIVGGKKVIVR